ncbi:unnamed protein product [Danaus chrysippus]|uniref:(African queen) hypothetical protein n=1 Tax=Danaus chrysippus TaxID=151541 RepID=A0A8J2QKY5_9NEOP|nr:unnamed protein product [Danaus chrysippus]
MTASKYTPEGWCGRARSAAAPRTQPAPARAASVAADSTFQRRFAAGAVPVPSDCVTVFNPCDVSDVQCSVLVQCVGDQSVLGNGS